MGEGGGQIVRTALTLSMVSGRAFEVINIRSGRPKPGLRPQHLEAVRACARICSAAVEGAVENSSRLRFEPGPIKPGRYRFEIRTAGSACLVLQTVYLPLALAEAESRVEIRGGTHVPWSPCYHYLERQWTPWLARLGIRVSLTLKRAGFYPEGGGEMQATIQPAEALKGLSCISRGRVERVVGLSVACNLPGHIAERQAQSARERLSNMGLQLDIKTSAVPAHGKGTFIVLQTEGEGGSGCYSAVGARGKPAEKVGREAARALAKYVRSDSAFDEYLADQILLPLALVPAESVYTTACVTNHLLTNAEVMRRFLDARIEIDGIQGEQGRVRVRQKEGLS